MGTLFELKDEILKGRRVKRASWKNFYKMDVISGGRLSYEHTTISGEDIFADDWELEPLPKVKKKIKLYAHMDKWPIHGLPRYKEDRGQHIFLSQTEHSKYIRLPSLDQEIEVEE